MQRPIGDDDCIAEVRRGEQLAADIYVLFDLSCSMNCNAMMTGGLNCCFDDPAPRINPVRDAVNQFLQSPNSAGISVGIGYFGQIPVGGTSCEPADYATPAVGIGPLPGQAQPIISSLAMQTPTGETPTGPALRGACSYTTGWKQQNPNHLVAILLVTDGVPEAPLSAFNGCNPTLQDAEAAAAECFNGPGQVRTFVLGVGANLANLTQIAQSGGTQQAYLVEGGNVTQEVFDALTAIRGSATVPCEFQIPPPPPNEVLNFGSVNIEYIDPSGARSVVYFVDGADQCSADGGGWYYDNPAAPSKIQLCPSTCTTVEAQIGAQVNVALGCGTIRPPM